MKESTFRKYARPARRHEQAHQLWPVLTSWAVYGILGKLGTPGLITYGEAANLIGYPPQAGRTLSNALWLISQFCEKEALPHLNAIVVNLETGEAGDGIPLTDGTSQAEQRSRVLSFPWFHYRQPTLRNFRDLQAQASEARFSE